MTIAVLGGSGFIGSEVVKRLAARGEAVAVIHRGRRTADLGGGVASEICDRMDGPALAGLLARMRPSVLIDILPLTLENTEPVFAAMAGVVPRYVMISSVDVYGNYGGLIGKEKPAPLLGPMAETAPLRTSRYPYPKEVAGDYDKIVVEDAARAHAGFATTVVRLPMVFGPHDGQHRFRWAIEAVAAGPLLMIDRRAGAWKTSYGFVGDVAEAIALAALSPRAAGRTYNAGQAAARTQAEWAGRVAEAMGKAVTIEMTDAPGALLADLAGDADLDYPLVVDTSAIRTELGFAEIISEGEALLRTIAWEQGQPKNPDAAVDPDAT